MREIQIPKLQAVSNIFNTMANQGIGPLPKEEIRARVIADLFFVDSLLIPSASLLCNPMTLFIIRSDQEFLDHLLKSKKIVPVFSDNAKSFSAVLDQLIHRRSAGLKDRPLKELRRTARFLDTYLSDVNRGVIIQNNILDQAKTETSVSFLENLGDILPATRPYYASITNLFNQDLEKHGFIPGSWWANLAYKPKLKRLLACSKQLSEIGTMVFDFPYSKMAKCALIGHSYEQGVSTIDSFAQPFLPEVEIYTSPGIIDVIEIDAMLFDKKLLAKIDFENQEILHRGTSKRRVHYLKAMNELLAQPSADRLRETKSRLDEYLIALSKIIRSSELVQYARESKSIRTISSYLQFRRYADKVVLSFVGTVAPVISRLLQQDILEFAIVTGVAKLAEQALKDISSKQLAGLENSLKNKKETGEEIRPVALQLNIGQ